MRNLRLLDTYRDSSAQVVRYYGSAGDETCGVFRLPSPIDKAMMSIVASSDGSWDHVSVSRKNRCPNWTEMEYVKRAFFADDETAMQLHVPSTDHISNHPFCLHLWRPQKAEIPRPPAIFVGMAASAASAA
jgi:hypothetical protein